MKKCLGLIFAGLATLGLSACSEDFDITAPYKDITVVYGLMNYGDTVQYIRVQKAFLNENQSALDLAKNPDSNYYRNIEVRMKAIINNIVVNNDVLDRVDLATEGRPKEPGTFFSAPNYAYKYPRRLDSNATYRLVIKNLETGNVDSADTRVIDTSRTNFAVSEFNFQRYAIGFSANNVNQSYRLSIFNTPSSAAYFEGYIRFYYVDDNNGVRRDTSFLWKFASNSAVTKPVVLSVSTTEFFNIFRSYVPPADAGQSRYLDSAEVSIWAADNNLYTYLLNNSVQGGLTADQIKPNYTTIRGKDVLGVFGARSRRVRYNVPIDEASLDSLKMSPRLRDLRFVGRSDH